VAVVTSISVFSLVVVPPMSALSWASWASSEQASCRTRAVGVAIIGGAPVIAVHGL
jgi:hypothetical protein